MKILKKIENTEFRKVEVTAFLLIWDILAMNAAYIAALWIRFDCAISTVPEYYITAWKWQIPFVTAATLAVMFLLKLYNSLWRFASYNELEKTIAASIANVAFQFVFMCVYGRRMPVTYFVIGWMLELGLTTAARFGYRFVRMMSVRIGQRDSFEHKKNVMVIGAGAAGRSIIIELMSSSYLSDRVCCVIDDDPEKIGKYIEGIQIVGGRDEIIPVAKKFAINQIIFAIPTATAEQKSSILNICKETGCELKSLPGMYQLIKGEVTIEALKDVAVEDLLGRDPIKVNNEEILSDHKGKVVLVTGGGGSIGSELCRQIAAHDPGLLIILDVYENNAYEIEQELKYDYPLLNLVTIIGSVRDTRRMDMVFKTYRPDIVYHAAAHKHVPLMESSPNEAIKNNVFGTLKTAQAADKYKCGRFVLISTDKAVNPTSIMGASKRLCEMIIQHMDGISKTDFVAVRFGNVLGSNGSVIPLFKKQIKRGGPVTVTHPDITRYFMTISEAVSLVLQAGVYARGGEIFILDMGDPVKIDDLAKNLIKLSGHVPGEDIKIEYTGLRPGEKLYEEKLMDEEGLKRTPNNLIHIAEPIDFDRESFKAELGKLKDACYENSPHIKEMVAQMTGTYHFEE